MIKTVSNVLFISAMLAIASVGVEVHAQTVVLDNFEGGTRTIGGHNLWDVYSGEGGTGTTTAAAAAAHDGSSGLQESLTAGTLYMHFFPNDGANWLFAHELITSGTWVTNKFNRMSFWVRHPSTMAADTGNGHNIELGTYVRCQSCDAATQNAGGDHYYHYYNVLPGVWSYVIVDNHGQHAVGGGSSDPGVLNSPTSSGASWNYFDALTRWYWNAPYMAPSTHPAPFYWDTVQFYVDNNAGEDVAHIASLEASYNSATSKLHVGFTRNASQDSTTDTTYTARYAFSDIWQLGFANATSMGTVGADGQQDYVNKKIEATVNLAGHSVVYIAIQKQGRTDFRQIALPLSSSPASTLLPPTNVHVIP